jgi:hypothetical protein
MILFRNTVVLALSLHAHLQSTIRIPKELSIRILGVRLATSCLATIWPMSCGCLKSALLLLLSKHSAITSEAKLRSSSSAFTAHQKRHTLRITTSSMPKKRKRSDPSTDEVVSSSEEIMSSGEETDSSSSPPPPRAPKGTPGRIGHSGRRNAISEGPGRQRFLLTSPPRPRPSNSDRQMTRLDVDWEVRQLERARRQQPESFGRRRAAVRRLSAPARASDEHSRRIGLDQASLLEEASTLHNERILEIVRRRGHGHPQLRELRARAAMATYLTYDNARTTLRIQNIPIIVLTIHLIRTPTLSTTPKQSTSPHSHY